MRTSASGTVRSGLGEGARFTTLPWAAAAFRAALGYELHPGTLNLQMEQGAPWDALRQRLAAITGIAIVPPPGFCAAKCFRVRLAQRVDAALVIPDVADYPPDKAELVAPVSLRSALALADGDRVELHVEC